jgi:nitroreductase
MLTLSPRELLTTTRAVRKRLDLTKPVEREVIEECIAIAQQAPTASNMQNWHFVVVTDSDKKAALAELYRKGQEIYIKQPTAVSNVKFDDPKRNATQERITSSGKYLVERLKDVPVHVIPCIEARTEGQPIVVQSAVWGSVAPAAWSFMLAARSFGLGTSWTSLHLFFEEEAANILNIPHKQVMQAALIPVAYTKGTDFKPAPRDPVRKMIHWNTW